MDSATVLLLASAIIIGLQIVSIVLIVSKRKAASTPEQAPGIPLNNDNRDFKKRRDENRFNRRPANDQLPRQFSAPEPQPVDQVEKSLRDINLKLKNAERDQENARRKIKDVAPAPQNPQGQNPQRRFDQNNNRPNRGRDDDFRRRDRDRHNRPQGGQFRDRNRNQDQDRPQSGQQESVINSPAVPVESARPFPAPAPEVANPRSEAILSSQPEINKEQSSSVPESAGVFHGRKVQVRRRILTGEEEAGIVPAANSQSGPRIGEVVSPAANPQEKNSENAPASPVSEAEGEAQQIHFGR